MTLTSDQAYVLLVLLSAVTLILSGRLRADLVALLVLVSLALGHQVSPSEAFAGFASPAIFTLAGLFVLTAAMNQAGLVQWAAERMDRLAGGSEPRTVGTLTLVGAALSLVINTAAAGSILLPVAVSVARRNGVPVSRVLMPVGFGVIVGGSATIFTTANIIMSGLLQTYGFPGLTMMDFLPTGGVLVVVSALYLILVGRRLLPRHTPGNPEQIAGDLATVYQLDQRLWELRIEESSVLADQVLAEARLDFPVLAIWRGHHAEFNPGGASRLQAGDILLVSCRPDQLEASRSLGLSQARRGHLQGKKTPVVSVEVVIPPRSNVIGQTLADLGFQTRYGLTVVALWREGASHRSGVGAIALKAGDALLVVGPMRKFKALGENPNYLAVKIPSDAPMSISQSALTLAVAGGVIFAAGLSLVSMSLAAVTGALALVLMRLLSPERAYAAVDWSVLVLIAGMAPMAVALEKSGLTTKAGEALIHAFGGWHRLWPVAAFYLLTVLMTQIVGGQVAALITGPLTLSLAQQLEIDLVAVAVLTAIACSNCFLTSVSHPVNALMAGPGGYRGTDFVRVGSGLQLLTFATSLILAHVFWGI